MIDDPLHVPANARETIWVFALDLPDAEAEAFVDGGTAGNWPLKSTLGADSLRARHIENFPARDLKGVGLSGYLVEGLGLDLTDVAPLRDRLDAEDQHIVILSAAAFGGAEQTLTPRPPLRHLGTFMRVQTDQRLVPLPGAKPDPVVPPTPGVAPATEGTNRGGRGIFALIGAAIVILILGYVLSGAGG